MKPKRTPLTEMNLPPGTIKKLIEKLDIALKKKRELEAKLKKDPDNQ